MWIESTYTHGYSINVCLNSAMHGVYANLGYHIRYTWIYREYIHIWICLYTRKLKVGYIP